MAREVTSREETRLVGPGRKYSPTRLRLLIKFAAENPIKVDMCRRAGISTRLLHRWIEQSKGGHPAFQSLLIDGEIVKFHDALAAAFEDAVGPIEQTMRGLATGTHRKVLTHQGRVQYRYDPDLLALGFEGPQAYLLDENKMPIPEIIEEVDPDMVRWALERLSPEKYRIAQKIDVNHTGGVLVVGAQLTKEQFAEKFVGKRPDDEPTDVEFEVIDEADPTAAGNPDE